MKSQLDLNVAVEGSRKKLAEATIEEAEYLENASEISGLRDRSSNHSHRGRQNR